jgi:hypothetical protein
VYKFEVGECSFGNRRGGHISNNCKPLVRF